jgi:choline dehydrogenase
MLGVQGLRIVDASSQPVMTNGHPMAVLVMMAERAADFILEERKDIVAN